MPGGGGTSACARSCCTRPAPESAYCSEVCAAVDRDIDSWWPPVCQGTATMGHGAVVAQAAGLPWLDSRAAS